MRLDGQARRHVAGDDEFVAKLPGLPRGRVDADMRRDAAENDGPHAAALEVGIKVGAEERAPGRLGDQYVAGRGKARSEVGKTGRQDFWQRGGLVDPALWPVKGRLDVHENDRRPRGAESFRQRLSALEQVFGRDGRELAAEDAVLQVDQHKGR